MTPADLLKSLAADQAQLATDQATSADKHQAAAAAASAATAADQAVAADQAKILADQQAIGQVIDKASSTGFLVDPTPDADGNLTLYVGDNSPTLYHTVKIPTIGVTLPDPTA